MLHEESDVVVLERQQHRERDASANRKRPDRRRRDGAKEVRAISTGTYPQSLLQDDPTPLARLESSAAAMNLLGLLQCDAHPRLDGTYVGLGVAARAGAVSGDAGKGVLVDLIGRGARRCGCRS